MRPRTGTLVKKRNTYYVVVSERDSITRKRKRLWLATGAKTLKEAQRAANDLIAPFAARAHADRMAHIQGQIDASASLAVKLDDAALPGIALQEAFKEYERHPDRPVAGSATMRQYAFQWTRFEKWVASDCPEATHLQHISPDLARRFMASLNDEGVSANTFNKYRSFLGMIFRVLAKPGRVAANPWPEIKPRKLQTARRRALSVEELRTICSSAKGEIRMLLALGIYTGARLGDCCTMRWDQLDLPRMEIVYSPRKTSSRSDGRRLRVPIHPYLAALLTEIPKAKRRGYILPDIAKKYIDHGAAPITQVIQAHFKKCGIATAGESAGSRKIKPVEVGFHSLRHTAVSLLRDAGASMSATMAITGHTSSALVDAYTHAGADAVKVAITSLPSIDVSAGERRSEPKYVLPAAVVEKLRGMSPETWQTVRDELLAGAE